MKCASFGDEMDDAQRFRTRVWKQPEDQWSNDAGSVSGEKLPEEAKEINASQAMSGR